MGFDDAAVMQVALDAADDIDQNGAEINVADARETCVHGACGGGVGAAELAEVMEAWAPKVAETKAAELEAEETKATEPMAVEQTEEVEEVEEEVEEVEEAGEAEEVESNPVVVSGGAGVQRRWRGRTATRTTVFGRGILSSGAGVGARRREQPYSAAGCCRQTRKCACAPIVRATTSRTANPRS